MRMEIISKKYVVSREDRNCVVCGDYTNSMTIYRHKNGGYIEMITICPKCLRELAVLSKKLTV